MVMNINQIFEQAVKEHQDGRLEEAEHLYRLILKKNSEHLDSNNNLGVILQHLGKLEEAKEYYKKAIDIKPDFAEAHNNLGNILKDIGKLNEAEKSFRKVIELKPDLAEAHNNFGNVLFELDIIDEAIKSYKKAIELKPDYTKAYNNLGNALYKLDEINEAKKIYIKAIELKPDFAEAHNNLGNTLFKMGKTIEAKKSYRKAIELKPDFAEAYCNLGNIQKTLNKNDQAEANFTIAINLKPSYKSALFQRGVVLLVKNKFELSLKDFDLCDNEESRAYALACLYNQGRIDDIYERIEKNSELDDENLRVASFSAFISYKEKKVTAYKFCNNPIDFISHSNLSTHLKNSNSFITEVIEELKTIDTVGEDKTTYNGFHSIHGVNIFENAHEKLSNLKSIIINEVNSYYTKFKNEDCSYIKKWPTQNNIKGWYIILNQQGYQTAHTHPSGWLSGVIYLKCVPHLGKNEGAIEFSLNGWGYSDPNSLKAIHQPKEGDIVLFPSSLHHKTIPYSTDANRIVVSFDLMPNSFNNKKNNLK